MLLILLIELVKSVIVCNCKDYREECRPYCKDYYVYKNATEREKMIGNIQMVDKTPFINYVKDKINGEAIQSQIPVPGIMQHTVGPVNGPVIPTSDVLNRQMPIVNVNTPSMIPNYQILGDSLRYNNVNYNICDVLKDQSPYLAGYNEEMKGIINTLRQDPLNIKRCEMLRAEPQGTIITTTRTVETTKTHTLEIEKTTTTTESIKKEEERETVVVRKKKPKDNPKIPASVANDTIKSMFSPNPNVDQGLKTNPMDELCEKVRNEEFSPPICTKRIVLKIQKASPELKEDITSTVYIPQNALKTTTVCKECTVSSVQLQAQSTVTKTEFKTSIIPSTSTVTLSKEITTTSVTTKTQIKTNYVREAGITQDIPKTRTRFITNVKTTTKTLYNTIRRQVIEEKETSSLKSENNSGITVAQNNPKPTADKVKPSEDKFNEEKMVEMLLYLRQLMTELKHIAEENKTHTSTTTMTSTRIVDHSEQLSSFNTILKELDAIKAINKSIEEKIERVSISSNNIPRTLSIEKTHSSIEKSHSSIEKSHSSIEKSHTSESKRYNKEGSTTSNIPDDELVELDTSSSNKVEIPTSRITDRKTTPSSQIIETMTSRVPHGETVDAETFTRKVLEVLKMKELKSRSVKTSKAQKERKTLTKTKYRTITISKKKKKSQSQSPSTDSIKETTLVSTLVLTDTPTTTVVSQPTVTLQNTIVSVSTVPPSTKTVVEVKTESITKTESVTTTASVTKTESITTTASVTKTESITKRASVTKTESITSTESVTTTKPVTTTKLLTRSLIVVKEPQRTSSTTVKGFLGGFKNKFYKAFKKPESSSSLEIFHSLVSENIVSLASAISEIKDKNKAKSDRGLEKTVTLQQDVMDHKKLEEEMSEIKHEFNEILMELKSNVVNRTITKTNKIESTVKMEEKSSSTPAPVEMNSSVGTQKDNSASEGSTVCELSSSSSTTLESSPAVSTTEATTTTASSSLVTPHNSSIDTSVSSDAAIPTVVPSIPISSSVDGSSYSSPVASSPSVTSTCIESSTTSTPSTTPATVSISTSSPLVSSTIMSSTSTSIFTSISTSIPISPTTSTTSTTSPSASTIPSSTIPSSPSTSPSHVSTVAQEDIKIHERKCKDGSSECIIDIPTNNIPNAVDIIYSK